MTGDLKTPITHICLHLPTTTYPSNLPALPSVDPLWKELYGGVQARFPSVTKRKSDIYRSAFLVRVFLCSSLRLLTCSAANRAFGVPLEHTAENDASFLSCGRVSKVRGVHRGGTPMAHANDGELVRPVMQFHSNLTREKLYMLSCRAESLQFFKQCASITLNPIQVIPGIITPRYASARPHNNNSRSHANAPSAQSQKSQNLPRSCWVELGGLL